MSPPIFIETERLYLRQWKPTDAATYIAMNHDQHVMEFFPATLTETQSLDHMNRMISQIDEKGYGLFAVETKADHSFIGFTGFSHPTFDAYFTPCIEIGWRLVESYWNKGFATEAAEACLNFGFKKLALTDIYSFTFVDNIRSEKVMQKIGMKKEGEFDHPLLAGHYLQKHILYKISKPITP
ncbi:MAG: GNAT family N-acetyltransferase [Sediminibacterium sp.]